MDTYRISLKINGSIMTPFQADTLFGHLCWVIAYQEGETELKKFLEPFRHGNPPFVLSDGFPGDLLPKPLSAEFGIDDPQKRKDLKNTEWISLLDFDLVRHGKPYQPPLQPSPFFTYLAAHNTISRLTNTTFTDGGVYTFKHNFVPSINIYLKALSEGWKDRVVQLFQDLSKTGFGRRKSIGLGHFSVDGIESFSFPDMEGADGFVTLSNFCPAEADPTEGLYKTFVKYGKLGEEFTFSGNPFKRPLVMIKAGSVFKTDSNPKEFYGRAITEGIAPSKSEVIQYAYAFAVPIKYPEIQGNVWRPRGKNYRIVKIE